MADATAAAATPAPRQTIFIDTDQIDVRDRLREIDWAWAEALSVTFDREGMAHPIEVTASGDRYRLVAGGHRWAAHTLLERPVECFVVDKDWAEARATEIAENVYRRELSALDRAAFIAELYEVEKARNGWEEGENKHAFAARKRWAKDATLKMRVASGLADGVAAKVGLSTPSIYRDLALHRALTPTLAQALAHAAPDTSASDLRNLAKLDPEAQAKAARAIANGTTVADALTASRPPAPVKTAEDKRLSAFLGAFSRMGKAEKRGALAAISALLPAGVKLTGLGGADE